jgi:hypothetical protein
VRILEQRGGPVVSEGVCSKPAVSISKKADAGLAFYMRSISILLFALFLFLLFHMVAVYFEEPGLTKRFGESTSNTRGRWDVGYLELKSTGLKLRNNKSEEHRSLELRPRPWKTGEKQERAGTSPGMTR